MCFGLHRVNELVFQQDDIRDDPSFAAIIFFPSPCRNPIGAKSQHRWHAKSHDKSRSCLRHPLQIRAPRVIVSRVHVATPARPEWPWRRRRRGKPGDQHKNNSIGRKAHSARSAKIPSTDRVVAADDLNIACTFAVETAHPAGAKEQLTRHGSSADFCGA